MEQQILLELNASRDEYLWTDRGHRNVQGWLRLLIDKEPTTLRCVILAPDMLWAFMVEDVEMSLTGYPPKARTGASCCTPLPSGECCSVVVLNGD